MDYIKVTLTADHGYAPKSCSVSDSLTIVDDAPAMTAVAYSTESSDNGVLLFKGEPTEEELNSFFRREFERTGALERCVMVLNLADDPIIERIVAPQIAQTIAEYLAFDLDMHILTIMTDMTNYGEALRSISVAKEEVPTRKGYPGYLYTDLATIYERAGKVKGKKGSVTLMPILN